MHDTAYVNHCWVSTNRTDDDTWPDTTVSMDSVFAFDCVNSYLPGDNKLIDVYLDVAGGDDRKGYQYPQAYHGVDGSAATGALPNVSPAMRAYKHQLL